MFNKIKGMLNSIANDCSIDERVFDGEVCIDVTINDFDGFDESWNEVYLEYDEDAVDALEDALKALANESIIGFYHDYMFDGFMVRISYASMDI